MRATGGWCRGKCAEESDEGFVKGWPIFVEVESVSVSCWMKPVLEVAAELNKGDLVKYQIFFLVRWFSFFSLNIFFKIRYLFLQKLKRKIESYSTRNRGKPTCKETIIFIKSRVIWRKMNFILLLRMNFSNLLGH